MSNRDVHSDGAMYASAMAGDAGALAHFEMLTDRRGSDGRTVVHLESLRGNTEHVRFILREFASKELLVKLTNTQKFTALHYAAYCQYIKVAEVLIDAARHLASSSADNDSHNAVTSFQAFIREASGPRRISALHMAVDNRNVDFVKLLVEADPSNTLNQDDRGKTPLYMAVELRYEEIVKVICTTCTAPSLDGPGGSTVLHEMRSFVRSHPDSPKDVQDEDESEFWTGQYFENLASFLPKISVGLSMSDTDAGDKMKSQDDKSFIDTEMVEVLLDAARRLSSTSDNPVNSFQSFLRRGDKDMNSALHRAVMNRDLPTAKLLVEADPTDRHTKNNEGKTPMYIAAENGFYDIMKMISTTCTVPSNLGGPRGSALHAAIKNLHKARNEDIDVIRICIQAQRDREEADDEVFCQRDEYRRSILELAVELNYVDMVELMLKMNLAYKHHDKPDFLGLMPLIYKARDNDYKDIARLLLVTYENSAKSCWYHEREAILIHAIIHGKRETVVEMLDSSSEKYLVTKADDLGWTLLHHAVYNQFDSIIDHIIQVQKQCAYEFVYKEMVSTPLLIAAEKGYTSTMKCLLQSWPSSSSSAYTSVDRKGQNILHLTALQNIKEMIQDIVNYCPEEYKHEIVNKQDNNGNTPLHLLIGSGCFIPGLMKIKGLDIMLKNKEELTPRDMLYTDEQIIDDQVQFKIELDKFQTDISESPILEAKRQTKDEMFTERMKEELQRYTSSHHTVAQWFTDAITGHPIAESALQMEADKLYEDGETILHVESKKGVMENVRFIVKELANKNLLVKPDVFGQTALHLAAHHGHTQVVEVLIDAARRFLPTSANNDDLADPISCFHTFIRQPTAQKRNTALHEAVIKGNLDIVKLLLEADPSDRHVPNYEGKTPIYMATENGYLDIIEVICTTCIAQSLEGPDGKTTALHALILDQVTEGPINAIRMMVNAAERWSSVDASLVNFEALFSRTDESGRTVMQVAMARNYVDTVKLLLLEDPSYKHGPEKKRSGLMCLIFEAIDNQYSNDIIRLLSETYEAGINPDQKDVLALILAMKKREEDPVLRLLGDAKNLVSFAEDNGWTPLHYAVYHDFDSILGAIIEAQENVGHQFVYGNMVTTPFQVGICRGYTSTVIRLMQSWPAPSSAVTAANSPFTVVNEIGQNILHLAATENNKDMVQGILKYCPEEYKDQILKQQDTNGNTPLHLLVAHGCFIPELMKHEGLDTMAKNKNEFTPWDMLYYKNDVVADQVHFKIALEDVQANQAAWNLWGKSTEKQTHILKSIVPPNKRRIKDVIFDEQKKVVMDTKNELKRIHIEKYKMRTNTQIIVTALITTVTFTVGFTMPGGLRQSGEVEEGMVLLSKKKAFDAFMISDALALLLSTSSLFFYFLESMTDNPHEVAKLNAASTVLNIVSVVAMMLTFIAGTYVVLSNSPAIAITVSFIGSLFFLLIIVLLIRIVYSRLVKRNIE